MWLFFFQDQLASTKIVVKEKQEESYIIFLQEDVLTMSSDQRA